MADAPRRCAFNATAPSRPRHGCRRSMVAAERVAATVVQGVHGRRRVGQGDAFWQYRHYEFGDSRQPSTGASRAQPSTLFVRENEWEAAPASGCGATPRPRCSTPRLKNLPTKRDRAELLHAGADLAAGARRRAGGAAGRRPCARSPAASRSPRRRALLDIACRTARLAGLPPIEPLPRMPARAVSATSWIRWTRSTRSSAPRRRRPARPPGADPRPGRGRPCRSPAGCASRGWRPRASTLIWPRRAVRDGLWRPHRAQTAGLSATSRGPPAGPCIVHRTDQPPQTVLLSLLPRLADMRRWGLPPCSVPRRPRLRRPLGMLAGLPGPAGAVVAAAGDPAGCRSSCAFPPIRLLLDLEPPEETPMPRRRGG
jgi:hypothetical protein